VKTPPGSGFVTTAQFEHVAESRGAMGMLELFDADGVSPNGHYTCAARVDDLIYTSIVLPGEGDASSQDICIEQQMQALLDRLSLILQAAGSNLKGIVRATIYLTDTANWYAADRIYAAAMEAHRPARGIVAVHRLRNGWSVAMDAVALKQKDVK
jgi:2-iminobutanoate/2-iminopropanoate deaminase